MKEDGLLIVDPAMADNGSLYYGFDDAFVAQMAKLCGSADIILPNITEAAFMTGCELRLEGQDEAYVQMILEALAKLGCKKIVLKGISFEDDKIGVVVYDCAGKKQNIISQRRCQRAHMEPAIVMRQLLQVR